MKRIYLYLIIAIILFGCWVLITQPSYTDVIYDENNFFENATVIVCAMAAIIAMIKALAAVKNGSRYGFWAFIALLCIVFVGDELSWGIGFLGIEKPRIAGIGFDGLHDILSIAVSCVKLVRDYIRSIGIVHIRSILILSSVSGFGVFLIYFTTKLAIKNRNIIRKFFQENIKWDPFYFLIIGLSLLAVAMVIDDDNLVGFPHKRVVEESMEFAAGAAFLFSALSSSKKRNV